MTRHRSSSPPSSLSRRALLRSATAAGAIALAPRCAAWAQSAPDAASSAASAATIGDWPADRLQALLAEFASRNKIDPQVAGALIAQAQYEATVARLILPGPPAKKNWRVYQSRFLDALRIGAGADFVQANRHWFAQAEQQYGVPQAIVAGILGVETIYGRNMGNFRVIDALSTLAMRYPEDAPRDRSAYFASQLGDFLQWCGQDGADPLSVRGSYAGAIGMPQFMPGSILRYAVDFDGAGGIDLASDPADAIGSVAHYLAAKGWQAGQPAHFPLLVPSDLPDATLHTLLAPDITPTFTAAQLADMGLPLLPRARDYQGLLAVVQLPNVDGPPDYVLGTQNFYVVTRYNHSAFYAQAVIELGGLVMTAATTPS